MTVYEGRGCGDFGYDILSSTSDQNQYFLAVSKAAYDNGTTVVTDLETPSPQMKRKIWGPSMLYSSIYIYTPRRSRSYLLFFFR